MVNFVQKKLIIFIIIIFSLIIGRLFYIIYNYNDYEMLLKNKTEIFFYGPSAPRGRILDINGKVIVDNEKVNAIFYHKYSDATVKEEIEIAKQIAKYVNISKNIQKDILKKYWLTINNNNELITEEEYKLLEERKLSLNDIEKLKNERITDKMLEEIDSD